MFEKNYLFCLQGKKMNDFLKDSDKYLVQQLKSNETGAFDSLFHRYSEKLYKFSFSLLKNHEDSKEIVQEAFIRIWEKRDYIDSSKSFKSFLFKISYNLIIDQLRSRLKEKEYREFLTAYFETENIEIESRVDYDTIKKRIEIALDELPDKRKKVFVLSREAGLSNKEIAAKLEISVKTVENQINLSLKHIRQRLGKDILAILLFLSIFS